MQGPVAQLVSAPPCHGGGRGFESRQGRFVVRHSVRVPRPGSSVGTSVRLKSGRSPVRSRPWPLQSPRPVVGGIFVFDGHDWSRMNGAPRGTLRAPLLSTATRTARTSRAAPRGTPGRAASARRGEGRERRRKGREGRGKGRGGSRCLRLAGGCGERECQRDEGRRDRCGSDRPDAGRTAGHPRSSFRYEFLHAMFLQVVWSDAYAAGSKPLPTRP